MEYIMAEFFTGYGIVREIMSFVMAAFSRFFFIVVRHEPFDHQHIPLKR